MHATAETPAAGPSGPGGSHPAGGGRARQLGAGAPAAAVLPLVVVTGLFAWWGWERGAYFGVVFYPGTLVLLGLLAALLLLAPWPALRGPAAIAVGSLLGIASLTAISALWSPVPAVAVEDALRVFAYATAFVLGAWLCMLLGRRMLLSLLPLAAAGALIALVTLVVLWTGDNAADFFEDDATLRYPLGYRNAEAAYFAIALWPMLVLAIARELDWRLRGALFGTATLALQLGVLSQSRSALFAVVVGAALVIALHPARLRMAGLLALVSAPVAVSLPWLLDVYQAGGGKTPASIPALHDACVVIAISTVLSTVAGLIVSRVDPSLPERPGRIVGGSALAIAAIALVVGGGLVIAREGGPEELFDTAQLSEGTPDFREQGSRFGFDLRSGRGDLWRVAIDDFQDDPIAGAGAGGFRNTYLLARDPTAIDVQPEDPHSVEMLMISELGLPGLLLLLGFVGGAAIAALRTRGLGPTGRALAAGSLAVGGYWIVHASVEWFWSYAGITLPVMFALGAGAGPGLARHVGKRRAEIRTGLLALIGVVALAILPLFFSERYTNHALRTAGSDLSGAYSALGRAADLNPFAARPLASEAVIAEKVGDRERALAALEQAQEREPEEWTLYFLEARVLGPTDPEAASAALARARALNPHGPELKGLERKLRDNL